MANTLLANAALSAAALFIGLTTAFGLEDAIYHDPYNISDTITPFVRTYVPDDGVRRIRSPQFAALDSYGQPPWTFRDRTIYPDKDKALAAARQWRDIFEKTGAYVHGQKVTGEYQGFYASLDYSATDYADVFIGGPYRTDAFAQKELAEAETQLRLSSMTVLAVHTGIDLFSDRQDTRHVFAVYYLVKRGRTAADDIRIRTYINNGTMSDGLNTRYNFDVLGVPVIRVSELPRGKMATAVDKFVITYIGPALATKTETGFSSLAKARAAMDKLVAKRKLPVINRYISRSFDAGDSFYFTVTHLAVPQQPPGKWKSFFSRWQKQEDEDEP